MTDAIRINDRLRVVSRDTHNYALERRSEERSKGEKTLGEYSWTPIASGHNGKAMHHVIQRELVMMAQDAAKASAIDRWECSHSHAAISLLADKKEASK